MKPRTKVQIEVDRLSKKLPMLSQAAEQYISSKLLPSAAYGVSANLWCTECGETFVNKNAKDGDVVVCPHCGRRVEVKRKGIRTDIADDYIAVPQAFKGWQVIRYFYVKKYVRKGQKPLYDKWEVQQHWSKPTGEDVVMQKLLNIGWCWNRQPFGLMSELTIKRDYTIRIDGSTKVYKKGGILNDYKRMGVTTDFMGICCIDYLRFIRREHFAETMLKCGMSKFVPYCFFNRDTFEKIKPALKISIRHGYSISDISLYGDYMNACIDMKQDLHNPKIACPEDLVSAHDVMIARNVRRIEREVLKEKSMENEEYIKTKQKFFDMKICDGLITIAPLKSVGEFKHEGDLLHHCVYKGSYYNKKNSLILSARISGMSIETIEIDLKDFCVKQCFGDHNSRSEYHDRILNLVNSNIGTIKKFNRVVRS